LAVGVETFGVLVGYRVVGDRVVGVWVGMGRMRNWGCRCLSPDRDLRRRGLVVGVVVVEVQVVGVRVIGVRVCMGMCSTKDGECSRAQAQP
jgi:hypothetical protein